MRSFCIVSEWLLTKLMFADANMFPTKSSVRRRGLDTTNLASLVVPSPLESALSVDIKFSDDWIILPRPNLWTFLTNIPVQVGMMILTTATECKGQKCSKHSADRSSIFLLLSIAHPRDYLWNAAVDNLLVGTPAHLCKSFMKGDVLTEIDGQVCPNALQVLSFVGVRVIPWRKMQLTVLIPNLFSSCLPFFCLMWIQTVTHDNAIKLLIGCDVPGSAVEITFQRGSHKQTKKLLRASSVSIADKRCLFEHL